MTLHEKEIDMGKQRPIKTVKSCGEFVDVNFRNIQGDNNDIPASKMEWVGGRPKRGVHASLEIEFGDKTTIAVGFYYPRMKKQEDVCVAFPEKLHPRLISELLAIKVRDIALYGREEVLTVVQNAVARQLIERPCFKVVVDLTGSCEDQNATSEVLVSVYFAPSQCLRGWVDRKALSALCVFN